LSRILIAEDERRLQSFLEKGLRAAGHATSVCDDGYHAASLARDDDFDLLILDLGLPGQDGFQVLRALRARGERLPVLVLTASHLVKDTVAALEEGADDYLTKPFVVAELMARVRARVRGRHADTRARVLRTAGLRLDLWTRRAMVGDRDVGLTAREFRVLEVFLRHRGETLSREQLLALAWDDAAELTSNTIDVYVSILRRKLGAWRFETVRGLGYRMPAEGS
jgi:DNA-binding response OmpR family regulator